MDISSFMSWFLNIVLDWFKFCFGLLENIEFLGTDLLTFTLSLMLITTFIPVFVAMARPRNFKEMRVNKERTKEND